MIDIETYALAKAYTDKEVAGGGAIKGKNCVITQIEDVGNTHIVHFQWTLDDGTVETDTMTVEDGDLVEASETNGNIKINGVETPVYNDTAVTTAIENIEDELSTDYATVEGNPINFSTKSAQNAESTIIDLEPIQDLHGYDYPWVGGAGKNKLPLTVNGIKLVNPTGTWSGNVYTLYGATYTILTDSDNNVVGIKVDKPATHTNTSYFDLASSVTLSANSIITGCPAGGSGTTYMIRVGAGGQGESEYSDYGSGGNIVSGTYHRPRIIIMNNATISNQTFYPMVRLSTESDATFAPYTNLCPITGRTEIDILGCGKNLFDKDKLSSENGYLDVNGNFIAHQNWKVTEYISLDGDNIIYNGLISPGESPKACWYDKYKNFISSFAQSNNITILNIPSNAQYLRMSIKPGDDMNRLMIYYDGGNSYSPYTQSNSLTISFGQTVYGGQLDVENGVLVVDKVHVDMGSLTWVASPTATANKNRFYSPDLASVIKKPSSASAIPNILCSELPAVDTNATYNNIQGIGVHYSYGNVLVYEERYISYTADQFKTAMDGVDLVYELATPITINLTPHTINLLKGINNISTDGDKITLTYRDGSVATLGDLTSAVDNLDSKIDESKILTDTATGDKYILVVTNGVLDIQQVSN